MKTLIKQIRTYSALRQQELADYMGVTFATINRWENGHAVPSKIAQMKLYDFCKEQGVPLIDYVRTKIREASDSIELADNRVILYHGSKSGIVGDISPISRDKCDFGKGFYMCFQMFLSAFPYNDLDVLATAEA